jgi:hypothetical protein
MTFEEYVEGKVIALVGPAPAVGDQTAEIETADIVYKAAQHLWDTSYTARADIVYFNGSRGRTILDDEQAELKALADPAEWWVYKLKYHTHRPDGLYRRAAMTPDLKNPNVFTSAIYDLLQFNPKEIRVYGTDLYAAGPADSYGPGNLRRELHDQAGAVIAHQPMRQRRIHRWAVSTGKVTGDDRYLAAVNMTDEEYQAVIARWAAAREEAA